MKELTTIILAAGQGTRLKSKLPKVMHPVCGLPMLGHVIAAARRLGSKRQVVIVGHQAEVIKKYLSEAEGIGKVIGKDIDFAWQKKQLGTGHAVQQALPFLKKGGNKNVLILSGDVPLISVQSLKKLYQKHIKSDAEVSLLTAELENPKGYGRIVKNSQKQIVAIVEEKNADQEQKNICEINSGIYLIKANFLKKFLPKIKKDPIKKEYYLTDLIKMAVDNQYLVSNHKIKNSYEIEGANTRAQLASLNKMKRIQVIEKHMDQGVSFEDPENTYIDTQVKIGADTYIESGVHLLGNTVIAKEVEIYAHSYLEDCIVKSRAKVGPFARIRPASVIGENAKVGNFVELKKTTLHQGAKAGHLSYLGDCEVGAEANIGAGTITCNYDGKNKFKTKIGAGSFIGSDTQLVAPVKVGASAYVAAGTTVTQDVPKDALAISRTKQKNIKNWVKKKK